MDGDCAREPEAIVDGWSRGEPGTDDYEEVRIVRVGRALRVRWVGRVPVEPIGATNPSHAIQVATRLMLRDWRRFGPSRTAQVPSPRGGGSAGRLADSPAAPR